MLIKRGIGRLYGGMTTPERRRARMEQEAVHIIEKIMLRRRWSAVDKDRLTDYLDHLVARELKRARMTDDDA